MRTTFRDYLRRKFGLDESCYTIDKWGWESIKIECEPQYLWYSPPSGQYSIIQNFILRKNFGVKFYDVWSGIHSVWIRSDILKIYPEKLFNENIRPSSPKFNYFDQWLDVVDVDRGGVTDYYKDPHPGVHVQTNSDEEYAVSFLALTYIDHLFVSDISET